MQSTVIIFALGSLIASLNIYLSFIRYPLHRLSGKKKEEFRFISGIPLFGQLLIIISLFGLWDSSLFLTLGIVLLLFDTGGIQFFLFALLKSEKTKK
ncbi:hypothetical protein OpiT1DRAFT_00594 [Opitutaceae bacterium TAV1]|nr:hypothetical protein OpiT1DRAFT_00594 [Opitutaceae bacterium TAV1]